MGINNRKNSTFIILGVGTILALIFMFQWVLSDDAYLIEMKQYREKQFTRLKTDFESPIPDSLKPVFKGLEYFPIDKQWNVNATFEKNPKFERLRIPRTDGDNDLYIIVGWAKFKKDGKEYKLTCYQPNPEDSNTLFIPFRDETTGKSTYGGGRYLDTRRANNRVVLDFNKAYNPYCVFDYDGYACPLPPEENSLALAVEAGEKAFDWEAQQ